MLVKYNNRNQFLTAKLLNYFLFYHRHSEIIIKYNGGGSGLILNDSPVLKLLSVGWWLMLLFGWAYRGST